MNQIISLLKKKTYRRGNHFDPNSQLRRDFVRRSSHWLSVAPKSKERKEVTGSSFLEKKLFCSLLVMTERINQGLEQKLMENETKLKT